MILLAPGAHQRVEQDTNQLCCGDSLLTIAGNPHLFPDRFGNLWRGTAPLNHVNREGSLICRGSDGSYAAQYRSA